MIPSLSTHLSAAAPHLSPLLVSPSNLAAIRQLAAGRPAGSLLILESCLHDDRPAADFSVCLLPEDEGAAQLAQLPQSHDGDVWSILRGLGRAWLDPSGPFHAAIENVWLEYDTGQGTATEPLPSIFVGFTPPFRHDLAIASRTVELLLGSADAAAVSGRLHSSYTWLRDLPPAPPHLATGTFQVGVMAARGSRRVRLCQSLPRWEMIPAYLEHMGWPGSPADLQPLLADFAGVLDEIAVHIEIGSDVSPKIGFELFIHEPTLADRRRRWEKVLAHFEAAGLCRPEKKQPLLDWIGVEPLPADPARALFGLVQAKTVLVRRLNHLKCVYEPGRPLQLKAYYASRQVALPAPANRPQKQPAPSAAL